VSLKAQITSLYKTRSTVNLRQENVKNYLFRAKARTHLNRQSSNKSSPLKWFPSASIFLPLALLIISIYLPSEANAANSSTDFSLNISPFLGLSSFGSPIVSPDLSQILLCGNTIARPQVILPTLKSTDFGQTFLDISPSNSNLDACHGGISATSADHLNIYQDDSGLVQSHDGGLTWDNSTLSMFGCPGPTGGIWAACPDTTNQITNIAISSNGKNVFITTGHVRKVPTTKAGYSREVRVPGPLFISHDFGKTWIERDGNSIKNWNYFIASSDGSELVGFTSDVIGTSELQNQVALYFSHDDGQTWQTSTNLQSLITKIGAENYQDSNNQDPNIITQGLVDPTIREVFAQSYGGKEGDLAMSSNGQIIYFAVSPYLLISTDGGNSWVERISPIKTTSNLQSRRKLAFDGVTTSSDGKIVATAAYLNSGFAEPVYTWFSNNYGKTWVAPLNLDALRTRRVAACKTGDDRFIPLLPKISSDGSEGLLFSFAHTPSAAYDGLCNDIVYINIPAVFPSPPPNPDNVYMGNAVPVTISKAINKSITCAKGSIKIIRTGSKPSCPTGYRLISKP